MPFKSDKRLYQTADRSRLVEESDPDAAFLFVAEGQTVGDEDAERYGLEAPAETEGGDEGEDDGDTKAEDAPARTKAQAKPAKTKARK